MHSCCYPPRQLDNICHHPNPSTAFQRKYFTDQLTEENNVHYHDEGVKGIHPILHMHVPAFWVRTFTCGHSTVYNGFDGWGNYMLL